MSDEGAGLSKYIDVDRLAKEAEEGRFMGLPIMQMNRRELLAAISMIADNEFRLSMRDATARARAVAVTSHEGVIRDINWYDN